MTEAKLISPLLDSFAMGSAIRTHNGVSCYPAMKDGSDNRYIVKVISVPASQRQLDALLLSGAYPDGAAANVYFGELVEDITTEAEVLRRLSRLEGFMPYENFQVVPMEGGVGFQVYLLSDYRRSLERQFQRHPMTYLGAINLGIDLCSAMAVCRQAGCLYIDLKPSNIYITPDGRYRIGDLGFVPMNSLQYASLPDKYRSSWTAPEIKDAFSSLNPTMDIYAIGLVLYQAYNNGDLPFTGDAPAEVLPPPMYADYEMADIILRACAPDPKDRWQTPSEMGQALVSYMQRNGANDVAMVPPVVPEPAAAPEAKEAPKPAMGSTVASIAALVEETMASAEAEKAAEAAAEQDPTVVVSPIREEAPAAAEEPTTVIPVPGAEKNAAPAVEEAPTIVIPSLKAEENAAPAAVDSPTIVIPTLKAEESAAPAAVDSPTIVIPSLKAEESAAPAAEAEEPATVLPSRKEDAPVSEPASEEASVRGPIETVAFEAIVVPDEEPEAVPEQTAALPAEEASADTPVESPEKPAEAGSDEEDGGRDAQDAPAESAAEDAAPAEAAAETEEKPSGDAAEEEAAPTEEKAPVHEELAFIADLVSDETAPNEEEDTAIEDAVLTEEVTNMLAQADDLLAHETPAPAVAPEPVEIPIPAPIHLDEDGNVKEEEEPSENAPAEAEAAAEEPAVEEAASPIDLAESTPAEPVPLPRAKRSYKRLVIGLAGVIVASALAAGGYHYYTHFYLQPVNSMVVTGQDNHLTVTVDSPAKGLSVVCTDAYGNVIKVPLTGSTVTFDDLTPDSHYTVQLTIDGFHKLSGETVGTYATPPQTSIVSFIATAGAEDGSVILNFTVDGAESEIWNVFYSAEGEEEQTASFTSHTATINGLTVGKEYSFRIEAADKLFLTGETELKYTATELVLAQNVQVEACAKDSLTISWTAPADTNVEEWTVHCYNEAGGDQSFTTKELSATFEGIDTSVPNTVEVTAKGMTKASRLVITANPVSVSNVSILNTAPGEMTLSWDYSGNVPEEGWVVTWTLGDGNLEFSVPADKPSVVIENVVPDTVYHFTIQTASTSSVFGGVFDTKSTEAVSFQGFGAHAEKMHFTMVHTPDVENWGPYDVMEGDITNSFSVGDKASFLVYLAEEYEVDSTEIKTLFVLRDASGQVIDLQSSVRPWVDMWYEGYCELDIPSLPAQVGSYSVDIFFNGQFITSQSFSVS